MEYLALIISLIALALSIEARVRDSFKLRYESFLIWNINKDDTTAKLCVRISNTGRRPIAIQEVYFEDDSSEREFPVRSSLHGADAIPITAIDISENQSRAFTSESIPLNDLLERSSTLVIGIIDSTGKLYQSKLHNEAYDFDV